LFFKKIKNPGSVAELLGSRHIPRADVIPAKDRTGLKWNE
jgi:hypothetical protein